MTEADKQRILKLKFKIHRQIEASNLGKCEKAAAVSLLFATDENFVTFVSNDTLFKRTGWSVRSLEGAFKMLENAGLIKREWGSPATRRSGKRSKFTTIASLEVWTSFAKANAANMPDQKQSAKTVDSEPNTPQPLRCENGLAELEHTAKFADNTPQPLRTIHSADPSIYNKGSSDEPIGNGANENAAPIFEAAIPIHESKKSPVAAQVIEHQRPTLRDALALWNSAASEHGWPEVIELTPSRKEKLKALLGKCGFTAWAAAIKRGTESARLSKGKADGFFTFDWLLRADENFLSLAEGQLDKPKGAAIRSASGTTMRRLSLGDVKNLFEQRNRLDEQQPAKNWQGLIDHEPVHVVQPSIENPTHSFLAKSSADSEPPVWQGEVLQISQEDFDRYLSRLKDICVFAELAKIDAKLAAKPDADPRFAPTVDVIADALRRKNGAALKAKREMEEAA